MRRATITLAGLALIALPAASALPSIVSARPVPGAPRCPVFPADNPWNQRVDDLPAGRNSARIIARIGLGAPVHPDFGSGLYHGEPIGIPYTVVAADGDARVPVSFRYASESDHGPYPLPRGVAIEGGYGSSGDRHVIVVDRQSCLDYELFAAYPHDGGKRWTGLPSQARVIAQALKRYGLILADNGSPWYISGAPDRRWNNDALHALDRLTGRDFEVVDTTSLPHPGL